MIDKIKEFLGNALCIIIVLLPLILLVLYFVVYFYALFKYGGRLFLKFQHGHGGFYKIEENSGKRDL